MSEITTIDTIFLVIEFLICLLGIFFNGLIIFIIFKNIKRLSPQTFLVLSIAVSDFLSCSTAIPFSIAAHLQNEWPFGMAGCQAHGFMVFLFALVSISTLAVISAAKYLTISRSLKKESYFNNRKILLLVLATWFYSFGFSAAPLVGWSRYGLEGTNATCSIQWDSTQPSDKAYFATVFIACFFLPMGMITFCYYKIHKVSKRIIQNIPVPMAGACRPAMNVTQALLKKHRRSAMYFLAIVAAFMLSWSPYAVVSFLVALLGKKLNAIVTSACGVFAKTSFMLNPIMYAILSKRFRRKIALIAPMTRRNPENRHPSVVPTSSHQPLTL